MKSQVHRLRQEGHRTSLHRQGRSWAWVIPEVVEAISSAVTCQKGLLKEAETMAV
jgi:hypothetical protein